MGDTQPEGAEIHNALCHILLEGVEMFSQRMNETLDKTTDYGTHLETYRCLDLLIKMFENLYPNIYDKKGEKTVSLFIHQIVYKGLVSAQEENRNLLKKIEELEQNQTEGDQHHVSEP